MAKDEFYNKEIIMKQSIYISKARESILSGFCSIQKKIQNDEWQDIVLGENTDYYSCVLFYNGKHIPLPIMFNAINNKYMDLQTKVIRKWLFTTEMIFDKRFRLMMDTAQRSFYVPHERGYTEPVLNWPTGELNENNFWQSVKRAGIYTGDAQNETWRHPWNKKFFIIT